MCGVWQKMQISVSAVAFTGPGPVTDRLCLLSGEVTSVCASTTVVPMAAQKSMPLRASNRRSGRVLIGVSR